MKASALFLLSLGLPLLVGEGVAAKEPKDVLILSGHGGQVYPVAVAPDGKTLASGSADNTVILWDLATGKKLRTFTGHRGFVYAVAFSPDGKTLASGGIDDTLRLWDVGSGKAQATFSTKWAQSNNWFTAVAFSPDGKTLASGDSDDALILWDVATGKEKVRPTGHTGFVTSVAFSPDGKTLASGSWERKKGKDIGVVKLWDADTGKELATLTANTDQVSSVAFAPDGKTLAVSSLDKTVNLWDVAKRKVRSSITVPSERFLFRLPVAFTPDGKTLATAADNPGVIKLWDVDTGKERATLTGHIYAINSLAFTPDGKKLASGSNDETVRLWDVGAALAEKSER